MIINFPTLLTLYRIFSIPFVMIFIYLDFWVGDYIAAILFSLACVSDYLDGHFARSLNQVSAMGTFLDPIADKLLVSATLLMLVAIGRIENYSLIPACIILTREIFVSGLREYLAAIKFNIPVSILAKWKTGVQMCALVCITFNSDSFFEVNIEDLGTVLLWLSAFLTIITAYGYWKISFNQIINFKKD